MSALNPLYCHVSKLTVTMTPLFTSYLQVAVAPVLLKINQRLDK